MICNSCGKNLPDGSRFCTGCGAQLAAPAQPQAPVQPQYVQQPQYAQQPQYMQQPAQPRYAPPAAPKAPNPIIANFVKVLKGFFSPKVVETVGASAQSKGAEWSLLFLLSVIPYALALAMNVSTLLGPVAEYILPFGEALLYGILLACGLYFLTSFVLFGALRVVLKKNVGLFNVFNLVATACLPLGCVWVLNAIFAYVWFPFVIVFSVAGFLATAVLLYAGLQRIDRFEKSPFIAFAGALLVISLVAVVLGNAFLSAYTESLVGSALGNLGNSLNSLSGLSGLSGYGF